jgi:hypothetical protein
VHRYTIVALHPEVFRVSYFSQRNGCVSLLASSSKKISEKDSLDSEVFSKE